jgi:hypothetical protein
MLSSFLKLLSQGTDYARVAGQRSQPQACATHAKGPVRGFPHTDRVHDCRMTAQCCQLASLRAVAENHLTALEAGRVPAPLRP